MGKVRVRKKNRLARHYLLLSFSIIILFYIILFQGRTIVSINWPEVTAQMTSISKFSKSSKITGKEINFFFVSYIYSYNEIKYNGVFYTKSMLFDSDVKYFAVRVNPKNPDEALFSKPPWRTIIFFFIIALSFFGIGLVNILENKEKKTKQL